MDGRFLPSRETVVRTSSGSLATIVETPLEDEILARWERREFTDEERDLGTAVSTTDGTAAQYEALPR